MKSLQSEVRRRFLLLVLGGIRTMGNFCPGSVTTGISPSLTSLEPRCFARLYANSAMLLLQRGTKWGKSEKDYHHIRVWRWVESFCGKLNGSVNPRPAAASPSRLGCKILQRAWRAVLQCSPTVGAWFQGEWPRPPRDRQNPQVLLKTFASLELRKIDVHFYNYKA